MTTTTRLIDFNTDNPTDETVYDEPSMFGQPDLDAEYEQQVLAPQRAAAQAAAQAAAAVQVTPTFLTAGRAKFTVRNPQGEAFTFQVSKPKDVFRGEFFASLIGPGSDDFAYIGMMSGAGMVRATKGSKVAAGDKTAKVLQWSLDVVFGRKQAPAGYEIAAILPQPRKQGGWRKRAA